MINYSDLAYLYKKGSEYNAYKSFGAHFYNKDGINGVRFSVFAPNANTVYLVGDFNGWALTHKMQENLGIWDIFIPGIKEGHMYKYLVEDDLGNKIFKADPYGFSSELRPHSASIVADPFSYKFSDSSWLENRDKKNFSESPINIYEVHLSSWDSVLTDDNIIDLKKTGKALVEYCKGMHYTHIELMPVTEHPLDMSWGYQCTGYFSLSGRYGHPENLQYFINLCHKNNLGVILDWVPGHYCPDEHGLVNFDGSDLFGGELHPHWGTYNFNFSNKSVWSFLLSSAVFWAKTYHIDAIRVDSVTSMLYLNYGSDNKTKKNTHGGDDDLAAKKFLKNFNDIMHKEFPGFLTFAEESSSYKGVTAPTYMNGLGFDYKWNMGWMNDTLDYFSFDYDKRSANHSKLTFSSVYARDEKFVLPFSHDEVVHGKKQLIDKMPGEYWRKFASLRTLMAYQIFHPGKKLCFMGIDIAQFMEWRYYEAVEWFMLDYPIHDSFHEYVRMLNQFYLNEKALYEMDNDVFGFEWIDADNKDQNIISFIRRAKDGTEIIILLNMSIYEYNDFRIGISKHGKYKEILSSNLKEFDGTGVHNKDEIISENIGCHNREYSINIILPPLSASVFKKI
jgi:1,4-alpha-glucan branching enzyme